MHTNIRNWKASAFIQIQICIQKYKYSYTYKYTTDHCDEHPVGSPGTSLLRKPFAHRPDTSFISFMYIFLYSYFLYSYFYVSIFISYFVIFVFFLYLYFYLIVTICILVFLVVTERPFTTFKIIIIRLEFKKKYVKHFNCPILKLSIC